MNNNFKLDLELIKYPNTISIDRIEFTNCALIRLKLDFHADFFMPDSIIVFSELLKSAQNQGKYLIFTDASGIADDGGWEGVSVKYNQDQVLWIFEYDNKIINLIFSYEEYFNQISHLENEVRNLDKNIVLLPEIVIFPESW